MEVYRNNRKKTGIMLLLVASMVCMLSMHVFAASYVAQIGSKKYKTMQSAVKAAKNGQTVKMIKAVSASKPVTLAGKKITIDFAKKKYTIKGAEGTAFVLKSGQVTFKNMNIVSKYCAATVASGAKLTVLSGSAAGCIKNSGTMLVKNGKFQGAGSEENDDGGLEELPAIQNMGSLTVLKGTFAGKNRGLIHNYGKAILRGGTYSGTNTYKNIYTFIIDNLGSANCVLTIEGGKYHGEIFNDCSRGGQMVILGGTFTTYKNQQCVRNADGRVVIAGGKFTGTDNYIIANSFDDEYYKGGTMIITGGTFSTTGDYGTVLNESEMIITGGKFLLNKAKKDTIRLNKMDDSSVCYVSSSLGLTVKES